MSETRSTEEIRRHESHLVAQIYHLIEANQRLETQVERLANVTEIAELFHERGISRDTFRLPPPKLGASPAAAQAWTRVEEFVEELPKETAGYDDLREALGILRVAGWAVDADWLADVRSRLIAAEQAIAYLEEQSREMDLLRQEKDSIVDGAARLEQNVDDLWKSLNEKTTHIRQLESQLNKIWSSLPYRVFRALTSPFRRRQR